MRDLSRYPITVDEILAAIDECIQERLAEGLIGDIRPVALQQGREIINRTVDDGK